jgi:hypothetical protein
MATDVVARLRLRAENFQREVRKAFDDVPAVADKAGREAGTRLGTGIGIGLKSALAAVSVGAIVNELAQVTARAIDFGVELGNNARALNTNVEELQAYREAAADVNVTHQKLDDGLQELFKTMVKAEGGNKDAVAAFKGLNVELRNSDEQAKTTTAVMGEVIDQIRRIPDPLRQAQYGAAIFGDQWQSVAPILNAGSEGLQRLTGEILATGDALSTKEIQELERVNSELERMKDALAVDVSQTVARNSEALLYMAERLYAVGHAAVYAIDKVATFLAMGATGPGGSNAVDQNRRIAGRNHRGQTVDLGDGLALAVGNQRQFAKGGRGSGRSYSDEERVARQDALREMRPFVRSVTDPLSAGRLGGAGGGGRQSRGGGGVDKGGREREAAAKRLRTEYERIVDTLDRDIEKQRIAAEIEALRAMGLDREAAKHEKINEIAARYPKLVGKTAEQLAKDFGISVAEAETELKKLDDLRLNALLEVDIEFDKKAADAAAKSIADGMKKQIAAQQALQQQKRAEDADLARRHFEDLSSAYFDLFDGNTRNLWDNFKRLGLNALAELAADQTLKLLSGGKVDVGGSLSALFKSQKGDLVGNMSKGALASSIAGALGVNQSKTGSMVGSLLGSTGIATKLLGSTLGPFGAAIGGILGGTLGGLFKKTPRGYATIGGEGTDLRIVGAGGNSKNAQAQGSKAAGATLTSLDQIAAALGGTYDASRGRVSIGRSGDSWHVDTSGRGRLKKSQGGFDFDDDYEAAVRFATMDLIKDGVLTGISDAAQRIMRNAGDDLEGALEKALMIEELPKRLKARLDPLGAALDDIDAQFARLADVLREGGASAEQIAQARQLWELERADAIREIGQASATLRDYLKTLRIGADSPLSLRTQAIEAEAAMAPFIAQIRKADEAKAKYDQLAASKAAGGKVSDAELKAAKDAATAAASAIDQSGFRDSAALFLDVSRQLGGSTKSFFDQFERVQGLTNNAIALVENAVPLRGDAKDPFAELTAKSTQATAAILDQQTQLLIDIRNGVYGSSGVVGGDFVGNGRNYLRNI